MYRLHCTSAIVWCTRGYGRGIEGIVGIVPQHCVKMTHFLICRSTAYNVHSVYLPTDYTIYGAIGYILHHIQLCTMNPATLSVYARYRGQYPRGTMGGVPPYAIQVLLPPSRYKISPLIGPLSHPITPIPSTIIPLLQAHLPLSHFPAHVSLQGVLSIANFIKYKKVSYRALQGCVQMM